MRPMFGAHLPALSIAWVSKAGAEGKVKEYGLKKRVEAVKGCRSVKKSDMKFNDYRPKMKVDPESYVSFLHDIWRSGAPTWNILLTLLADCGSRRHEMRGGAVGNASLEPGVLPLLIVPDRAQWYTNSYDNWSTP
jgi:hypothetical protein